MKLLFLVITILCSVQAEVSGQTKFVLEPTQSMIMTGKGPGQDATINPYSGQDCYAVVKNIGKRQFSMRVQKKGRILEEITIQKGEVKEVKLLTDYELYLDPNPEGKGRARVDYKLK